MIPTGDLGYYEPMSGKPFVNALKHGGLGQECHDLRTPQVSAVPAGAPGEEAPHPANAARNGFFLSTCKPLQNKKNLRHSKVQSGNEPCYF